jgi:hypothetical protein
MQLRISVFSKVKIWLAQTLLVYFRDPSEKSGASTVTEYRSLAGLLVIWQRIKSGPDRSAKTRAGLIF